MYQVYNMGHRLEVYCTPQLVEEVITISSSFGIEAQVVGRTEPSDRPNQENHVTIRKQGMELSYG